MQWREANRRRQRHTIRHRGLVPTPPPPRETGVYASSVSVAHGPPGVRGMCHSAGDMAPLVSRSLGLIPSLNGGLPGSLASPTGPHTSAKAPLVGPTWGGHGGKGGALGGGIGDGLGAGGHLGLCTAPATPTEDGTISGAVLRGLCNAKTRGCRCAQRAAVVLTIPTLTPDLPFPQETPQVDRSGPQTFPTKHAT